MADKELIEPHKILPTESNYNVNLEILSYIYWYFKNYSLNKINKNKFNQSIFPPIVYSQGSSYLTVDGRHRLIIAILFEEKFKKILILIIKNKNAKIRLNDIIYDKNDENNVKKLILYSNKVINERFEHLFLCLRDLNKKKEEINKINQNFDGNINYTYENLINETFGSKNKLIILLESGIKKLKFDVNGFPIYPGF